MKKLIPLFLLLSAFSSNAQEGFFIGNNNYIAAPRIPTLEATVAATLITPYSANVGGFGIDDGGYIAEKGVVWSTTSNPTIDLPTKRIYGLGSGNFATNINGLTPATTYYVRCFAKNIVGTTYGSQISFTTPAVSSDYSLPTVNIGNQIWTNKNLEVANYRNGDPIPFAATAEDWIAYNASQTGAYMYLLFFNPSSGNNYGTYGKLYNWYAVNDSRGLAPVGYHVPNKMEWSILMGSGSNIVETSKINRSATSDWGGQRYSGPGGNQNLIISPNPDPTAMGTNVTGFNILPGANSYTNGASNILIGTGLFWTSTGDTDVTRANWIYFANGTIYDGKSCCGAAEKGWGMSIRLLKDQ
jgi:uncharacterized protein (TIGR02145 family)